MASRDEKQDVERKSEVKEEKKEEKKELKEEKKGDKKEGAGKPGDKKEEEPDIEQLDTEPVPEEAKVRKDIVGSFNRKIGWLPPKGKQQWKYPKNIIPYENMLLLIDSANHCIHRVNRRTGLNATRKPFLGVDGIGAADDQFNHPFDACIIGDEIFIADYGNNRVTSYNLKTKAFIRKYGKGAGGGDGYLAGPWSITTDGSLLYVVERENNRISIFDPARKKKSFRKKICNAESNAPSSKPGEFNRPSCVRFHTDAEGKERMFIADAHNHRIHVYNIEKKSDKDKEYKYHATFGAPKIKFPTGLAINGNQLFVCEYGENRISIFDISNDKFEWKKSFPSPAPPRAPVKVDEGGKDALNSPWGLCVLFNELFVVDSCNHQLQVYH